LESNEWYFSDAFEKITCEMTPADAFSYIPSVVSALLELKDDTLIWETLYLLIELYSIADTTEIHPVLKEKWSLLNKHILKFKDAYDTPFHELKQQLRLKNPK